MTPEERAVREAIAEDLRAVADLYADRSNDYHCAVRAAYLSAADRVLMPLPAPITTARLDAVLDDALDDCCEEHD